MHLTTSSRMITSNFLRLSLTALLLTSALLARATPPLTDDQAVWKALGEVLAETRFRATEDSYVVVPVHFTGCPSCVKIYIRGDDLLDGCSTRGFGLVYIAPVDRRVQWSALTRSNSYPVKTIPDMRHQLTEAIGSTPKTQKAIVVHRGQYRIVAYDITAICAAMAELKKK